MARKLKPSPDQFLTYEEQKAADKCGFLDILEQFATPGPQEIARRAALATKKGE